jgi:hypothetical protein
MCRHGAQGSFDGASNATLENEFGTSDEEAVIKQIIERGTLQEHEVSTRPTPKYAPLRIIWIRVLIGIAVPRENRNQERQYGRSRRPLDSIEERALAAGYALTGGNGKDWTMSMSVYHDRIVRGVTAMTGT